MALYLVADGSLRGIRRSRPNLFLPDAQLGRNGEMRSAELCSDGVGITIQGGVEMDGDGSPPGDRGRNSSDYGQMRSTCIVERSTEALDKLSSLHTSFHQTRLA